MLLLNGREVERLADMPRLVTAVEAGVREQAAGQVVLPPRLNLPNGRGFFRLMPTVMNGSGIMGFKAFHGSVLAEAGDDQHRGVGEMIDHEARGLGEQDGADAGSHPA